MTGRVAWRLLSDAAGSGPWNMAVDEALLASAAAGGPPTLRLYGWGGSWLSLGYSQRLEAGRAEACAAAGVGVVRRSTGGAAVLHGADLTYAVAAPEGLLPAGREASYARIAEGLSRALCALGLEVAAPEPRPGPRVGLGFDCFAEPAGHELCAGGRKLVGSAQRRANGAVLQHGSLRLRPDPPGARAAAGLSGDVATSLEELGCQASPDAVRSCLAEGLGEALRAELRAGGLHPAELRTVAQHGPSSQSEAPAGISQGASAQADRY